jgi:hypothetical protein
MKTLTLYSRPDCGLCDDLADALVPLLRGRATLEIVDIDEDLDLKKRYGLRIPVLVADGREFATHPPDLWAVEAFLAANDG